MSNLKALIKYDFINSYGINKLKDKNERLKSFSVLGAIILAIIIFSFSVYNYFNIMTEPLKMMGMLDYILVQGILISVLITFGTTFFKAPGMLFGLKDFDMLISMPVKAYEIMIAKIVNLMLPTYVFSLVIYIPTILVYALNSEFGVRNIIYVIIMYLFLPLIPVSIASIFAFVFSFGLSKIRNKNIFLIVILVVLTLAVMLLSTGMESVMTYLTENANKISEAMGNIYPPIRFFIDAAVNGDIFGLFKFVLSSIVVFGIFILALNKVFKKISSSLLENAKKNDYKMTELKDSSVTVALLKKELKQYFSKPMVVLNTSIGSVIMLIMPLIAIIGGEKMIGQMLEVDMVKNIMPAISIATVALFVALSNISASSISLEGNRFWIMKSLPISEMDIFKGKILLSLTITLIPFLISLPLYIIGFKLNLVYTIMLILAALILSLYVAIGGLLLNLKFPMMVWTSETVVVKQSISSMLSLLVGGGPILLFGFLFIKLGITNIFGYISLVLGIILIITIILFFILKGYGVKRVREIQ